MRPILVSPSPVFVSHVQPDSRLLFLFLSFSSVEQNPINHLGYQLIRSEMYVHESSTRKRTCCVRLRYFQHPMYVRMSMTRWKKAIVFLWMVRCFFSGFTLLTEKTLLSKERSHPTCVWAWPTKFQVTLGGQKLRNEWQRIQKPLTAPQKGATLENKGEPRPLTAVG